MALIKCSECGRTVSDKAAACAGCGAPLTRPSEFGGFNLVPEPSTAPPPSRKRLMRRAMLAALAFVLGVIWSSAVERQSGDHRVAATIAALLVTVGLCGVIVTAVQFKLSQK